MLSDEELIDQVMLLYIAGHETTVNLIGNGILALLRQRAQLDRLQADPSLDANAIEELLRYDPPVQMTRRITLHDVEVGGHVIEAGTFVVCVIASANRDRIKWGDDAEALDITREDAHNHLAFGLEGRIAIATLVRRFPRLELAGEPTMNGRINLRGVERLPLTIPSSSR